VFDNQCAEQDDGVLECNRIARGVQEMPSILGCLQGSLRYRNAGSVVIIVLTCTSVSELLM